LVKELSFGMKSTIRKPADVKHEWWIIDAADQVVGRLAVKIATVLMGKHRPDYTPHVNGGDFIIVTNAEKLKFTGRKWDQKTYARYSGYPSGLTEITAAQMREKAPNMILEHAVRRMLPKNKLARQMLDRLKIYDGTEHPHQAQQPKPFNVA
jgi:large subunit ribosomal protein L13